MLASREGLTAQSSTGQEYYLGGIVSPLGDPMYSRDPHAISYLVSGTLALNTEHVQLPQCLRDWAEHVRDCGRGLHDHHRVGREKRNTGGLRWIYEVNRSGSEDPGDRPGRGKTTGMYAQGRVLSFTFPVELSIGKTPWN